MKIHCYDLLIIPNDYCDDVFSIKKSQQLYTKHCSHLLFRIFGLQISLLHTSYSVQNLERDWKTMATDLTDELKILVAKTPQICQKPKRDLPRGRCSGLLATRYTIDNWTKRIVSHLGRNWRTNSSTRTFQGIISIVNCCPVTSQLNTN